MTGENSAQLFVVSTPIGNLGDITPRAIEALRSCDVIFCEDTRVTGKLLSALEANSGTRFSSELVSGLGDARAKLRRLDENILARGGADDVLELLGRGERVAYCTDAGMPAISDPGQRLVAAAREADFEVEILPGASAAATAYVASGFEGTSFFFGGFMPRKDAERRQVLTSLATLDAALIFYESPNRLIATLEAIHEEFPFREVAVCRELTKLHEEVARGRAIDLIRDFSARPEGVKGEIVIVIGPPAEEELRAVSDGALAKAEVLASNLAKIEGLTSRDIQNILRDVCNISRNDAYNLSLL